MFGHQNHDENENNEIKPVETTAPDQSIGGDMSWQHPGTPLNGAHSAPPMPADDHGASDEPAAPADDHPTDQPATETHVYAPDDSGPAADDNDHTDTDTASDSDTVDSSSSPHDLIDIKRDALGKLTPLVGHLDQTPEEKFRTTMMMIQASDNQSLIQTAYDAAQEISDEKVRAQALLDVINEINYFTQPKDKDE
jgi:hypothetical protein